MDAGFTLGQVCTNSRGACPAGTDTRMCGALQEKICGTTGLKGYTSATMHMLLSDCGGHAGYHVHESLACEYNSSSPGHSTMVAVMLDGRAVYGQYESTGAKPTDLDACGGHTGPTPASTIKNSDGTTNTYGATAATYHYHVQAEAPFFAGCFGPVASLAAAAQLYSSCAAGGATWSCSQYTSGACTCAAGTRLVGACTSLGSYASYTLDCPVYKQGSFVMSQLNTSDPACPPCAGNCPGVAAPAGTKASSAAAAAPSAAALAAAALVAALLAAAALQ